MLRCRLSLLMGRDKLRIADVARATGLKRSALTALYRETATRIELALCGWSPLRREARHVGKAAPAA